MAIPSILQLKRDSAADWTSNNPTLAAGRIGIESDTRRFKFGDGATAWTSLAYAGEFFDGLFTEAAAPSTPASGKVILYAKTDGLLYSKDDAGTETLVSGGTGFDGTFTEAAAPATPAAGKVVIYAKTDGLLYSKDDAGTETLVSGGAGGGGGGGETWDASFDGQGQVVVSGTLLYRPVASTGTIAKAALVGDVSGAVTVTVKKYTPAGGALGSSTTLGTIALATAQHNSSTPSWAVTAGDVLEFSLGGTITSVTKVFVRLST